MAVEKIEIFKRENLHENVRQRWNIYNEHEKVRIVRIWTRDAVEYYARISTGRPAASIGYCLLSFPRRRRRRRRR